MSKFLRCIGDCHGDYRQYDVLTRSADLSIQIGDLGLSDEMLTKIDINKHRYFRGNHDDYSLQSKFALGDYGPIPKVDGSFFIRGAWSIDKKYRVPGVSWWPEEELNIIQADEAYKAYCEVKPRYMFSHDCPFSLLDMLGLDLYFALSMGHKTHLIDSVTNRLLDKCFSYHQPEIHFFGHYHRDFDQIVNGTRFICLTADRNLFKKQKYFDLEINI